ncbi:NAD(P)H-dependent flavin oxidoreductase [Furfurilactobacillus cerevisiae]|uniref:NAD(P)H-dependent flavin oxidoreductase n=1 Tax=Furfurilactobacillus rossiae TaxID=231049 RepID=UPI003B9802EF
MTLSLTQLLNIKYPVIQGAMAWLTDAKLVAAVSEAGGLGVLGPNAGQTTVTRDPIETAQRLTTEIEKTRTLTSQPFGVNLILPKEGLKTTNAYFKPIFDAIIAAKVPVVVAVGDANQEVFQQIKTAGIKLLFRALTPTVENTKEAVSWGADAIIATGFDEGGELPNEAIGTFSILPTLVTAVDVPVIAAGGITSAVHARAARVLGAAGLYVGTRFITSEENPAADSTKQLIVNSTQKDLTLFDSDPTAWRSLPTPLVNEIVDMQKAGKTPTDVAKRIGGLTGIRLGMLEGKLQNGIVTVDTAIDEIHNVLPAQAIVEELMAGFDEER